MSNNVKTVKQHATYKLFHKDLPPVWTKARKTPLTTNRRFKLNFRHRSQVIITIYKKRESRRVLWNFPIGKQKWVNTESVSFLYNLQIAMWTCKTKYYTLSYIFKLQRFKISYNVCLVLLSYTAYRKLVAFSLFKRQINLKEHFVLVSHDEFKWHSLSLYIYITLPLTAYNIIAKFFF